MQPLRHGLCICALWKKNPALAWLRPKAGRRHYVGKQETFVSWTVCVNVQMTDVSVLLCGKKKPLFLQ